MENKTVVLNPEGKFLSSAWFASGKAVRASWVSEYPDAATFSINEAVRMARKLQKAGIACKVVIDYGLESERVSVLDARMKTIIVSLIFLGGACGQVSETLPLDSPSSDSSGPGLDTGPDGDPVRGGVDGGTIERLRRDSDPNPPTPDASFDISGPKDSSAGEILSTDLPPLPLCGPEHLPACACIVEGPLNNCRCPDGYEKACGK